MYKSAYTGEYYFSRYEMELAEAEARRNVRNAGGSSTTVVSYDAYGRRKTTTTTTTVEPPRPLTREERDAAAGVALGAGAFIVGATLLGALFGGDD